MQRRKRLPIPRSDARHYRRSFRYSQYAGMLQRFIKLMQATIRPNSDTVRPRHLPKARQLLAKKLRAHRIVALDSLTGYGKMTLAA